MLYAFTSWIGRYAHMPCNGMLWTYSKLPPGSLSPVVHALCLLQLSMDL